MSVNLFRGARANVRLWGAWGAIIMLLVPKAAGKTNAPARLSTSDVAVQVTILGPKGRQPLKDKSGVAVWLVPMDNVQNASFQIGQSQYRMLEHNKMFEPHVLVVPTGSIVEFPNRDPWFHYVFSISDNRRFDLGAYGSGGRKYVKFDRAGATYVFCQIHPDMAAVILTVDSLYFGISDKAGHVSIGKVPAGKYVLHIWYEDAEQKTLNGLQSDVIVVEEKCDLPVISVAIVKQGDDQTRR